MGWLLKTPIVRETIFIRKSAAERRRKTRGNS
jgi:hypothetical protein